MTEHPDEGCRKNGNATREKSCPIELNSQCRRSADLDDDSFDSEWGASNTNQTHTCTSTNPAHGWTLVKRSKSQKSKSAAESALNQNRRGFQSIYLSQGAITNCSAKHCKEAKFRKHESKSNIRPISVLDWPSLPGPSSVEDNSSLQGSNPSATKRFSANRVEFQELTSEQKAKEHLRRSSAFASLGFAGKTDYDLQQSHSSSRHLESTGLESFRNRRESPRQDLFSTDLEPFFRPDVTYTGLAESRMPVRSSQPSSNSSTKKRTVDLGNTPKSQWDLANKAKNGVVTTTAKSELPLNTVVSPQVGSNSRKVLPQGVYPLCVHFLQDNRKGQPFRQPNPCLNCTKHSKLLYGTWRSETKEWQEMRPYPKAVNSNVLFQLCWHFSNRVKCEKNSCTFAHGKEELMFWNSQRQSGRL